MKEQIVKHIEAGWEAGRAVLIGRVEEAFRRTEELLRLEDYLREGHKKDNLGKAMKGFGEKSLNLSSLSKVLGAGDVKRLMEKGRYERIHAVQKRTKEILAAWRRTPPSPRMVELTGNADKLLVDAGAHLSTLAEAFKLARIARLETKAKYVQDHHDAFFKDFGWEQFEDEEIRICPPFVILAELTGTEVPELASLIRLVSSGCPVKAVLMRVAPPRRSGKKGRAAALRGSMDVEMLPVALREAYLLQCATSRPEFAKHLAAALSSPRPAVISLFCPDPNRKEGFRTRAEKALSSRAHPIIAYDPDRSVKYMDCFDLSGNPALDRDWPLAKMNYRDEKGQPQELECDYTFANFAVGEPGFEEEFSSMPVDLEGREAVPLARYLALPSEQRPGKVPFVHQLKDKGKLVRLLPSSAMIVQTAERLKLWRALRELAGIGNPHVQAAERRVTSLLRSEQETALRELEKRLQSESEARQNEAIESAMRRLAERLTGIAPSDAPATAAVLVAPKTAAPAAAPAPAAPVKPAGISDSVWIETKRCTTCDECTNINKKIFAYDGNKQAVIKDPKGGPFKDIVRAAEKCSARIIHPGVPANPDEKDLKKWVERAKPFQ